MSVKVPGLHKRAIKAQKSRVRLPSHTLGEKDLPKLRKLGGEVIAVESDRGRER